jgi:AraC-like DNA-binding protein
METISFIPHSLLQPYIQAYAYTHLENTCGGLINIDLYPIGYPILSFVLKERHVVSVKDTNKEYHLRFNFTGQLDRYLSFQTRSPSLSAIYIIFKPFGAYKLFGVPQRYFVNESVSMVDFLPNAISVTAQMEEHTHNPTKIVSLLEKWLLQQLLLQHKTNTDRVDYICGQIESRSGNLSIKELCKTTGISKTSLEDHFREKVGLGPKMYSRVVRFNNVNQFIQKNIGTNWQELIYQFNYFDQAHFIKEFKGFFGYTPSQAHLSGQNLASHLSSKLALG